jgi:hypothetical protein
MADQQVVKIRGADLVSSVLRESAIQEFRALLQGALLCPGDAGYEDTRRIWNGMVDRRPALRRTPPLNSPSECCERH